MKKYNFIRTITVCGLWLACCVSAPMARTNHLRTAAPVAKTGSFKTMDVPVTVNVLPITADLDVSETKAVGTASGPAVERELLIQEAMMKALGQDPPSPSGADLLVGMEVFTEESRMNIEVVVTGYPARYVNFRTAQQSASDSVWLVIPTSGDAGVQSGGRDRSGRGGGLLGGFMRGADGGHDDAVSHTPPTLLLSAAPKASSAGRGNAYFTPRWNMLGAFAGYGWWGFNVEGGYVWANGLTVGGDFGFGLKEDYDGYYDESKATVGGGLNIGREIELSNDISITVGGAGGCWFTEESEYYWSGWGGYDRHKKRWGIIGPFAGFRIYNIELKYRLLLGPGDGPTNQMMLGYRIIGKRN